MITFWQKYYRSQLRAIERIMDDKTEEFSYGLKDYCIIARKECLRDLLRTQIYEYSSD